MNKRVKVIFPASMKNVGLLFHFTNLTIELARVFRNTNYSFLMISEKNEQNIGLWDKVRENLLDSEYAIFDNYQKFDSVYKKYLGSSHYDHVIILTQGIMQFFRCIPYKLKYKNKLILYTRLNSFKHGSVLRRPLTYFLSYIFGIFSDIVNFQCNYTFSIFVNSKFIINRGKAVTIPLGLSDDCVVEPTDNFLRTIFEPKTSFKIVYLAQLHKHKNHKQIIYNIGGLLRANPSVKLFFLGRGLEMDSLRLLVNRLGLSEQIIFLGRVERALIPWILQRADLAFALSNVETFGHVILEPLYYNVPVISKDVGIASDIIMDFNNGFIIRHPKLKGLEDIVGHFIHRKYKITNNGYRQYSWQEIAKSYYNLFDKVILEKSRL